MRIVIAGNVWPTVLERFYVSCPRNCSLSYNCLLDKLMSEAVGAANFYSKSLRQFGWEAEEIVINDRVLQTKWVDEHLKMSSSYKKDLCPDEAISFLKLIGGTLSCSSKVSKLLAKVAVKYSRRLHGTSWINAILTKQIETIKPDVFYTHAIWQFDEDFLKRIRPFVKLIVAQHASKIPEGVYYAGYDLIVSSLPNLVSYFKTQEVQSEYLPWCFEKALLERIQPSPKVYDVSFVGGNLAEHANGMRIFDEIATNIPIHFWGYGKERLLKSSAIYKNHHGELWGLEMYRVLAQSKIVINRHIDLSGEYANNLRMFEVTGVGSLLITDHKSNLCDFFEPNKEILVYESAADLKDKIKYYLEHDSEREAIARQGQIRTLRDHTYGNRMKDLNSILQRHLLKK